MDITPAPATDPAALPVIDDIDFVIDTVFEGPSKMARLLRMTPGAISNYRRFGYFPPRLHIDLPEMAMARGYSLAPQLFVRPGRAA